MEFLLSKPCFSPGMEACCIAQVTEGLPVHHAAQAVEV
jgi:hypothetical protein